MIPHTEISVRPKYEYYDEKRDEKLSLHEAMHDNVLYDTKRLPAAAA